MNDLHGVSSEDEEIEELIEQREAHVTQFTIPPLRQYLKEIARLSARNPWIWEFRGQFVVERENGLCQLLCFQETIAEINNFTLTVGGLHNSNFAGTRIFRLGMIHDNDNISIVSIGSTVLFCDDLFFNNSKMQDEGIVMGLTINSR